MGFDANAFVYSDSLSSILRLRRSLCSLDFLLMLRCSIGTCSSLLCYPFLPYTFHHPKCSAVYVIFLSIPSHVTVFNRHLFFACFCLPYTLHPGPKCSAVFMCTLLLHLYYCTTTLLLYCTTITILYYNVMLSINNFYHSRL